MTDKTTETTEVAAPTEHKYYGRATLLAILAAMSGLMFGLDTGVVAGALPFITSDFNLSNAMQGILVSSMMIGAALGSFIAGHIASKYGRTRAMMGAGVLFLVGTLLCAIAPSALIVTVGRVGIGLAVGVAAFTAPLYISEITLETSRGGMISFYQLMVSFGIFVAFIADSFFSHGGHWRLMIGWLLIPAVIFMIIVAMLPNTPRWLLQNGKTGEARKVLRILRSDKEVADNELKAIQKAADRKGKSGLQLFLSNKNFRRSVALGITLQIMQQLTGINALLYYAPRIFSSAHFTTEQGIWATSLVGLVNMAFTGVAIAFADKLGRRPLLSLSCFIAGVSLLGVGYVLGWMPASLLSGLILCGLLFVFVAGFAIGEGPLVWAVCSEIQPGKGRDFGIGCSTVVNWVANGVISAIFPIMMAAMGAPKTFIIFAALNGLFLLIVFLFVPETKGATLEQIETKLMAGDKLRNIGA